MTMSNLKLTQFIRLRNWSELHEYKTFQCKTVTGQLNYGLIALKYEIKVLNMIDTNNSSRNMETTCETDAHSTLQGKYLQSSVQKYSNILELYLAQLQKLLRIQGPCY